jgi:hypothetical protein
MLGVAHPVSSGGRRLRHLLSIGGTGAHNGLDSFAMRRRMTTVCPQRTAGPDVALLGGKLFDDHGNRMTPTRARKEPKRWRYCVSQAALQGDNSKAGSGVRVPAANIETLVAEALGKLSSTRAASQTDIRPNGSCHDRPREHPDPAFGSCGGRCGSEDLDAPLSLPSPHRDPDRSSWRRPSLADRTSVRSAPDFGVLALREGKTDRSIRMTLSLAFPRPRHRQDRSRRTSARFRPQTSR